MNNVYTKQCYQRMYASSVIPATLEGFITDYDKVYEDLIFGFPHHIKMKVIKKYQGKKSLPNSLSFLATTDTTADIVEIA